MLGKREYHVSMRRSNRATGAAFAGAVAFALVVLQAPSALAQVKAAPPSVTSMGFGGRKINGTPPSVTSVGPHGFGQQSRPTFQNNRPLFNDHHSRRYAYPWSVYAVPSYGYYDNNNEATDASGDQYNGGPTIFDRRGSGAPAPPPAMYHEDRTRASQQDASSEPEPQTESEIGDQPQTVLVFKDGHQLEVENYAIVGGAVYDLSAGRAHKIPISDLDLTETAKQNDDRGIEFKLPGGSAN